MERPTRRQIVVVDYDPAWPRQFNEERARIARHVPWIRTIEHVGSTAVPGLAAKPIIDMLAAVDDLSQAEAGRQQLESLGYEFVDDPTLPERRYFRRRARVEHTHHLHVYPTAGFPHRVDLLFRDYLRLHPETMNQYAALKRHLAERFRESAREYTEGKTEYVREVVGRALEAQGLHRSALAGMARGKIERATPADLARVKKLLAAADLVVEGLHEAFGFLVARRGSGVVGSVGLEIYGSGALLRSVVVEPALRGSGVGSALVEAGIQWSRELGIVELYLLTTTAAAFFERFEFEPIQRSDIPSAVQGSRELSSACCETAMAMRRAVR